MKKTLLLLTLLYLSVSVSAQSITKSFPVKDIQGITASSIFDIELTKSGVESVVVMADKEAMPFIEAKVVMGQLNLKLNTGGMPRSLRRDIGSIKVKVNMSKELSWLTLSGASRLVAKSEFTPQSFKAQISGASSASGLDVSCNDSKISVSGASNISLTGKVNTADYEFTGACNAVVSQNITNLSVECSGATKLDFTGRVDKMDVEVSGASFVKLRGNGDFMKAEVTGASKMNAIEFILNNLDIEVSGVSHSVVNVQKTMEAEVSGGSSLEYKGSPVINKIEVNSVSNIKKIN